MAAAVPRRGLRRAAVTVAEAQAAAARAAWAAHLKLCWQCHSAGGRPGLFCDPGFRMAQAVTRTRAAAAAAGGCPDQAQGTLL